MELTWREAVKRLADQIEAWRPEGFAVRRPDPAGAVLDLERADGRAIRLEPAEWAGEEFPAEVDFYSNRGPRVRFEGPLPDGSWRVLTSDLLDIRLPWTPARVAQLCEDLVAR